MHNSKHDDLCQSHLRVHYMVRFIWDPALFHNYILEMLNFLSFFFFYPLFQCQMHLKPFSLISSTSDSSKMIDQTIRILVELLINASQTLPLVPGSLSIPQ